MKKSRRKMKLAKLKEYKIKTDRKNFVCIFITSTDGFIASHFMGGVFFFYYHFVGRYCSYIILNCIVMADATQNH